LAFWILIETFVFAEARSQKVSMLNNEQGTRYVEYLMMKYCAAVKSKISKIIQQK
jgi:hypothetical protein